jgi:hypothetical protein
MSLHVRQLTADPGELRSIIAVAAAFPLAIITVISIALKRIAYGIGCDRSIGARPALTALRLRHAGRARIRIR